MSVSKEIRIGVLVTIALVILFIGFYFLKGASLFSSDKEYYCFYSDAEGLQNSANVQVKGLNVGHVTHLELKDGRVRAIIALNKNISIPQGTVASLASFDLLGTKMIRLDLGTGAGQIPAGDTLPTTHEVGILDNVTAALTPRLQELKLTIAILDSTLRSVNMMLGQDNQKAISGAVNSMKVTADNLSHLSGALSAESGEISGIIHNTNSITANFAKENDTVKKILSNVSNLSGQLANAPIQQTVTYLQGTIAQLQGVVDKINNNQGSLGMLINNKDMYNNLNGSLQSLSGLMDDIKAHPKRYINVTIFGKK
jgi:phospholipid/cholesterol/gamma-HCH transport system substrate-binding protein